MFKICQSWRLRRALPFVVYSGLAVVILWDLLLPGYVLVLDMVFTPKIPFPRESPLLLQHPRFVQAI